MADGGPAFKKQKSLEPMEPPIEHYPKGPARFYVPPDKKDWAVDWPEYKPTEYTASSVAAKPYWADNNDNFENIHFNVQDGDVNRRSHAAAEGYRFDVAGYPLNPTGRTGIRGRGLLGRYGPNHAADPIVTRFLRNAEGELQMDEHNRPIVQFVSIKRTDNGEWALPGGMVEPGTSVSKTLKAEFGEEALNALEATKEELMDIKAKLDLFFSDGAEIFRGIVNDPRNTDNAWMETVAMNFHDHDGTATAKFKLKAGDDACGVAWTSITDSMRLYASHADYVMKTRNRVQDEYAAYHTNVAWI